MENVAYLMHKGNMNYFEVLSLPIAIFFSLLKQFRISDLCKTEEGYKLYQRSKRLQIKEPDFDRLRSLEIYKGNEQK